MPGTAQTAQSLLDKATQRLRRAGIADATLDSETLLRHELGWDRARLVTSAREFVTPEAAARFFSLVDQRAARRPLQHLIGTQAFWRHDFLVTPDVLIPRPETELLVEAALERLRATPHARVADVGTGSGCIALSLAAELPETEVHALDVSPAALAVARRNASRLDLERVRFHEGDLLAPVSGHSFDAIVSNPPYVDRAEAASLMPEVADHEPVLALFAPGADAYGVYRRLIPQAYAALVPGGFLALEVGQGMADTVAALCEAAGLPVEAVLADLQRIPRTVVARRPRL